MYWFAYFKFNPIWNGNEFEEWDVLFAKEKKNATFTTLVRCFIANNHKTECSRTILNLKLYRCWFYMDVHCLETADEKHENVYLQATIQTYFFVSLLISFKVTFNNFPDCWAYNNISYIYFCCKITNNSFDTAYFNRKRWKTNNIQYRRETVKEKKKKYTQHMFTNTHTHTH